MVIALAFMVCSTPQEREAMHPLLSFSDCAQYSQQFLSFEKRNLLGNGGEVWKGGKTTNSTMYIPTSQREMRGKKYLLFVFNQRVNCQYKYKVVQLGSCGRLYIVQPVLKTGREEYKVFFFVKKKRGANSPHLTIVNTGTTQSSMIKFE